MSADKARSVLSSLFATYPVENIEDIGYSYSFTLHYDIKKHHLLNIRRHIRVTSVDFKNSVMLCTVSKEDIDLFYVELKENINS